jgi:hypothetical protein
VFILVSSGFNSGGRSWWIDGSVAKKKLAALADGDAARASCPWKNFIQITLRLIEERAVMQILGTGML